MVGFTNYLEKEGLELAFGNEAEPVIGTYYIALADQTPTEDMTDFDDYECVGGGYARQAYNNDTGANGWIMHGSGVVKNKAEVTFPEATASWGDVYYFAICRHLTADTGIIAFGAVDPMKTISAGDTVTFPTGSITIRLD